MAITPNGKTAYVASKASGTVTPITVATNKAGPPITITATPDSFNPLLLGMTRDGSTVYAAGGGAFDAISTATNTVTDSVTGVVATDLAARNAGTTTQAFTLTVLRPPAIGQLPFIRGTEGTALTVTITTTGYPAPGCRRPARCRPASPSPIPAPARKAPPAGLTRFSSRADL